MVSSDMDSNEQTPVQRRNPPGTKAQDFCKWPEQKFDEMESTLAVLQYIQQTIRQDFTATELILTIPPGQDEGVWKYEHLRQFCMELNGLAVKLQSECTPKTCSQMTATEQWIFLCAAHKTPRECPAIDYTRHTLDGAACLLNSNKYFPSRVSIKESSVAKLGSVCRRVYRIFSHAYYHHRHIFDEAENETYLCRRFTEFVIKYNLMSQDNLIVPILDESALNSTSNNNSAIENMLPAHFHVASKPEGSTGISSFLNLPEGVVQDFSEAVEDCSEEDLLDVDGGTTADDDFSFSGDFGTLKPMKTSSMDAVEDNIEDAMNNTAVFVEKSSPENLTTQSKDTEEPQHETET